MACISEMNGVLWIPRGVSLSSEKLSMQVDGWRKFSKQSIEG